MQLGGPWTTLPSNTCLCLWIEFYGSELQSRKEHKPLCPSVSFRQSPTYKLSSHLLDLLVPLVGRLASAVCNSRDFATFVILQVLTTNEVLVSFDVKSLFTNVPTDLAIEVARRHLEMDETPENCTCMSVDDIIFLLSYSSDYSIGPPQKGDLYSMSCTSRHSVEERWENTHFCDPRSSIASEPVPVTETSLQLTSVGDRKLSRLNDESANVVTVHHTAALSLYPVTFWHCVGSRNVFGYHTSDIANVIDDTRCDEIWWERDLHNFSEVLTWIENMEWESNSFIYKVLLSTWHIKLIQKAPLCTNSWLLWRHLNQRMFKSSVFF